MAATDPAEWVERHGDALFRYALRRVRDRELAEEIVQETFVAALRGRDSFDGRSTLRTWLIAILRRKIVDHFRRARAEPAESGGETSEPKETWFGRDHHWRTPVAAWSAKSTDRLAGGEFRRVLDDCLGGLSPPLSAAFVLRELEGLETDELCKVLRITPSNLWTQLHRARMLLRRCLEMNWFSRT